MIQLLIIVPKLKKIKKVNKITRIIIKTKINQQVYFLDLIR